MSQPTLFIVNLAQFHGSCESSVYTDAQGVRRVHYSGGLYREGGAQDFTPEEYQDYKAARAREKGEPVPDFRVRTWEELSPLIEAHERLVYLTGPYRITADQYDEMLNVLPPENWTTSPGFQHFRMCEYTTSDITNQYARARIDAELVHICKAIRVTDRSTWITLDDFKTARPEALCL